MDPGRTVQKHQVKDRLQCRTIGASWEGDPSNPTAATNAPVLVFDEAHDDPQQLRPEEAERLKHRVVGRHPFVTDDKNFIAEMHSPICEKKSSRISDPHLDAI